LKVYLKAYLRKNLGDDLFLEIITNRYPNTTFYGWGLGKYDNKQYLNLKIKSGYRYIILNKLLEHITKGNKNLDSFYMKKYDKAILLGGSMFIQNNDYIYPMFHKSVLKGKDYYILGVNFGPYKTESYKESVKEFISQAKDVCFREKSSYELFKEFKNTRYSSDIVYSLNTDNVQIKNEKKVVISVVDCNKKFGKEKTKIYEEKIIELIRYFIKSKYEVVLMSFCKFQGDEIAVKRILKKCSIDEKKYIEKYYYRGNTKEALNVIANSEIVVGTRFHANVIGLLLGKTIIPIAYNNKTINMLNDIGFAGKKAEICNIEKFNPEELTYEQLNYKINVEKQKLKSNEHFKELDKILK